jgi:hypothetical protein
MKSKIPKEQDRREISGNPDRMIVPRVWKMMKRIDRFPAKKAILLQLPACFHRIVRAA